MASGDNRDMQEDETAFLYELARDSRVSKLLEYLTTAENPTIRRRTAEILGNLETERPERIGTALLRASRTDESDEVRAAAIDAMYLRDEGHLEQLIGEVATASLEDPPAWMGVERTSDWLEAEYPEFRMIAAGALGRIGNDAAIGALVEALSDSDVRVRTRAVESCGAIGDPRCIEPLADRLDDSHEQVRRAAVAALAGIGTSRALDALSAATRSAEETVRLAAVGELDRFDSLEPLGLLLEALEDESESVRRTAMRTTIELLANAPSDRSHEVRTEVAERLFEVSPSDLTSQLLAITADDEPRYVRRNATWLLGRLAETESECPDEVERYLIETLGDSDEVNARFAISTLIDLEEPDLVDRLQEFVQRDGPAEIAKSRAEFIVRKRTRTGPSREAVANSVEFTYVSDPSDYTAKKREREGASLERNYDQ